MWEWAFLLNFAAHSPAEALCKGGNTYPGGGIGRRAGLKHQ